MDRSEKLFRNFVIIFIFIILSFIFALIIEIVINHLFYSNNVSTPIIYVWFIKNILKYGRIMKIIVSYNKKFYRKWFYGFSINFSCNSCISYW